MIIVREILIMPSGRVGWWYVLKNEILNGDTHICKTRHLADRKLAKYVASLELNGYEAVDLDGLYQFQKVG